MKRYIRIDIECETTPVSHSFATIDNIKRILEEDMPYAKIIFSRDAPKLEDLDKIVVRK